MGLHGGNKYILIIILLIIIGCNEKSEFHQEYTNNKEYQIEKGDSVNIYVLNSSMQTYCSLNFDKLNHIKFVSKKKVEDGTINCVGCITVESLVFKGISQGIDTLVIIKPYQNQSCEEASIHLKQVDTIYINVIGQISD